MAQNRFLMKALCSTLIVIVCIVVVAACTKRDTKTNNVQYYCKCSGGFSGAGFTTDMGNLNYQEATVKCNSYNQPGVADGYHDCHLE